MALLDTGRLPRDILPPIKHPDFEQSRSDKGDRSRFSMVSGLQISTIPLESPNTVYAGPPPPYSCASSTTAESTTGLPGYFSPSQPGTRRSTRDEKDLLPTQPLPSLPSIQEALGGKRSLSLSGAPSTTQSTVSVSTPVTATGQILSEVPRGPLNPFSNTSAPFSFASSAPSKDSISSRTPATGNPGPEPVSYPPQSYTTSPQVDANTHRSSVGSFSSVNRPLGEPFTSNTSHITESKPQQTSSYRDYNTQPPTSQPHPLSSFPFEPAVKFDETRNPFARSNAQPAYGDVVKRHLEVFDAELALKEVTEASSRTFDFSRSWAQRYHQSNRSSYFAESAPSIQDIEEMIRQQHRVLDNLSRIRDVVVMEQNTLSEQRARAARGHLEDEYHNVHDEYKSGGFAGGDAKKRRGKAAPPGRCHSCNRSETPEWRRGPDGARTLCNACGLHFAKLTRKLGANKAGQLTGSALRPKGLDPRPTHT